MGACEDIRKAFVAVSKAAVCSIQRLPSEESSHAKIVFAVQAATLCIAVQLLLPSLYTQTSPRSYQAVTVSQMQANYFK